MNYRLYTFVAHHYLSPLQCGLQTAHVVGDMSQKYPDDEVFKTWADIDKTIIICGAGNHRGVVDCWTTMKPLCDQVKLPVAIFYEDERSMNRMATACGIVVPEKFSQVKLNEYGPNWELLVEENGKPVLYRESVDSPVGQLITHIKRYRLV